MPCINCCNSGDCYGRGIKGGPASLVKVCEALDIERSSICMDVSGLCDGSAVIDAFIVVSYRDRFQDCGIDGEGEEFPIPPGERYEEFRWFEDGYGRVISGCVWPCAGVTVPPPTCVATDIPLQECVMLTNFYTSNGGASWTDNTNWNTNPAANWFGIQTSPNNVTSITLQSNNVTGAITSTWEQLTQLRLLYLFDNSLTGSIPTELGNLSELRNLRLQLNGLTGSIPTELGNLTNLYYLDLSDNSLSGTIPTELGNLANLLDLRLHNNTTLSGTIPTELGNLTNLLRLYLDDNALSGSIPAELGNLTNLLRLRLENNALSSSIPTELGNLLNLELLYLFNNSLTGSIPTALGNLTNLLELRLNDNTLSGTIPTELGNLANLTKLYLHNNTLSGTIPTELGNLTTALTQLLLDNNTLSGTIPTELGNLANLTILRLNDNTLSGSIPTALGNLFEINNLDISSNTLTGTNDFVFDIYANRALYNDASPVLQIDTNSEALTGNYVAPPGVGVSDSDWSWNATTSQHDPLTGKAAAYALVNDPNAEGTFNLWTITF